MTKPVTGSEAPALPALAGARRIALVAGGGSLPVEAAERLADAGHRPFVVIIEGEASEGDFSGFASATLRLEQFGRFVSTLRRAGVSHLVMAGSIARRPRLTRMEWRLGLVRFLPRVISALARGDDGLLRAILGHVEDNGIRVVGVHEVVPDMLAPDGILTERQPTRRDEANIAAAFEAATAIGRLDIGQAAIAVGGRAVALEGIEGTDGLLERMVGLRAHGRLADRKGGVLAKCAKPGQEMRVDLPTIGPETVEGAHAAGLAGIVVEAGRTFVVDCGQVVARANALGLFVAGRTLEADK